MFHSLEINEKKQSVFEWGVWLLVVGLIIWNVFSLISCSKTLVLHEDEYQHTHLAWNTLRGKILYRDFDESHGPLSTFLYSLFLKIKPHAVESISTFYYLRFLNVFSVLITGVVLGLCVFQLTNLKLAGVFGLLIYLASPAVRSLAFRIRPDCYVALFSVLSLFCWLKGKKFLMGLCLGLALGFHAKYLPINCFILLTAFALKVRGKNKISLCVLGESLIGVSLGLWFWYHRALSFAWESLLVGNFRTAYKRLFVEGDVTRLFRMASQTEVWVGVLVVLAFLTFGFHFVKKRKIVSNTDWIMAASYFFASFLFLFAPVWSHALVFVIPTGLIFLVSIFFIPFKFQNVLLMMILALCIALSFVDPIEKDRGKEIFSQQLQSLEAALRETKRSDRVFYIWTSRCPAYVFNEDPSRTWMNEFSRTVPNQPIRMLPPIDYLAIHPMFLGLIDQEERDYIQNHFKVDGCFWKRIEKG
jgi:hypothetical protein